MLLEVLKFFDLNSNDIGPTCFDITPVTSNETDGTRSRKSLEEMVEHEREIRNYGWYCRRDTEKNTITYFKCREEGHIARSCLKTWHSPRFSINLRKFTLLQVRSLPNIYYSFLKSGNENCQTLIAAPVRIISPLVEFHARMPWDPYESNTRPLTQDSNETLTL